MNKQEIIDYLKGQTEWSGNHHYILVNKSELISMIEDLDELEFKNYLRDIKSQIDYLRIQGPGKVKSLRMLENMVDNMLTGYWSSTSIRTEKVKVPAFVAEWFEKHKEDMRYWIQYAPNHPIETLIRMKDGYTVKPKRWVVKDTRSTAMYFNSVAGVSNDGDFGCGWSEIAGCVKFTDKAKADAVATLIGGTVEKV